MRYVRVGRVMASLFCFYFRAMSDPPPPPWRSSSLLRTTLEQRRPSRHTDLPKKKLWTITTRKLGVPWAPWALYIYMLILTSSTRGRWKLMSRYVLWKGSKESRARRPSRGDRDMSIQELVYPDCLHLG